MPFVWTYECAQAFEKIKQALTTEPILAHQDPMKPSTLYTDASDLAIGAILAQKDAEGQESYLLFIT